MKLWKKMLLGMTLGVIAGLLLKEKAEYLKPIGTLFLSLLNMLVILLVFSSMTVGVTSIQDFKKLGRVGIKTLLLYMGTTAIAILFGLFMAKWISPGSGLGFTYDKSVPIEEAPSIVSMFISLVPSNPIAAFANGNIMQIIVFSIFLGIAITLVGERGKPLIVMLNSLADVMLRMTGMVMSIAPYGIFAIMAWVSGTFGVGVLLPLLKLVMAHYLTCILHMIIIFGGILVFMAKVPVMPFFKGMSDAIALAASTTSSSATLPATIHCVEENLGVSKNIATFILPLGSTVNMNGTAIFQGIASVFISQAYGIELGWSSLLMIVVTATFAAVGTAGVPGAGLITLSIVLSSVGLPLEGIAIVAGIDRLRDIVGTVVNILGDAVVAVYVAKSENELDIEKYNSGAYVSYEQIPPS